MRYNEMFMEEITAFDFETSGALVMINQILSWHGLGLAVNQEHNLVPVKLKMNVIFNEDDIAAAKRQMSRYMVRNAGRMICEEAKQEIHPSIIQGGMIIGN